MGGGPSVWARVRTPSGVCSVIETLADIDALILRCRSDQSREYLSEAVQCYRSGAYRATIVTTWIAVVFDLIDKIRELALYGDANARVLEQQYETYLREIEHGSDQGVKSALQFERDILTTCKQKLQLLDQQQYRDLDRLREDRHRCAHPSFQKVGEPYRPSAEQARLHFRNAVMHVLAQPPVQGRSAIAALRLLVGSQYFPTDSALAVTQLKSSALDNPSDALVKGFIDDLLFGFFDKDHPLHHNHRVMAAINACIEMHRPLTEHHLSRQLPKVVRDQSDQEFLFAVILIARISGAWGALDAPAKDKVIELIRKGKSSDVIKVLSALARLEALKPDVEVRVGQLTVQELGDAIGLYRLRDLGKGRAIQLLAEAHSWSVVNEVFDKAILPLFESLDRSDIEKILVLPSETGSDLLHSGGLSKLIERVRQAGLFQPDELDALLKSRGAGYLISGEGNI